MLPKLPPEGAPLVSLDITGVQRWRRGAEIARDREGEDREDDSQKEGDRAKNNEKEGGICSDRDRLKGEAIQQKGVLAALHAEIAQAEMEAGLVLLAQLIQVFPLRVALSICMLFAFYLSASQFACWRLSLVPFLRARRCSCIWISLSIHFPPDSFLSVCIYLRAC